MKNYLAKIGSSLMAIVIVGITVFSINKITRPYQYSHSQPISTEEILIPMENQNQDEITVPTTTTINKEDSLLNPAVENMIESSQVHPALSIIGSKNQQIIKLDGYQEKFGGFVADRLMVFTNMPQTASGIQLSAQYIARTSKEFKKYGIKPIFIFEPSDENGSLLNLKKISQGKYQKNLDRLFSEIKKAGVTGKDLGILIPYPEINTPSWDRKGFSPDDFPLMANGFFDTAKNYFSDIEGGLLLNGSSYATEEKSWNNGKTVSFSSYVTGIKKTHIQHVGLQGFPWVSDNGKEKHYDAEIFLPIAIVIEAARIVGADTIWFNTGTFREKYSIGKVSMSPNERSEMLGTILKQAEKVRIKGFNIWINIFAQNKMRTPEKTDWSYLEGVKTSFSEHEKALADFVKLSNAVNIPLSLFDR